MLNISNNNNNNSTRILELIKYPVPYYFFILSHTRIQCVTLTTRGSVILSYIFQVKRISTFFCFGYYVFKSTPVVCTNLIMQGFKYYTMYISHGGISVSGGDA